MAVAADVGVPIGLRQLRFHFLQKRRLPVPRVGLKAVVDINWQQEIHIDVARRPDRRVFAPGTDEKAVIGVRGRTVVRAIQAIHDAGALGEAVPLLQRRQCEIPMKLLKALPDSGPMGQPINRRGRKHR
nr:hypothetical protein [Burkholderia ubonensis]